ncbi:Exopolysaccharide synthesis, ExoD [Sulfitobacter guttiformis KCTC 32187]|nr:Exopolysaccharide synthesis, ExoD [Sulfitobacter guttiformis KCTC 32187]
MDIKFSNVLRLLLTDQRERISLNDIIRLLGDRSFVPLLIIFALPNLFFFIPGGSVITGPPLIFISGQLVLGRPSVWLPDIIGLRSVDHAAFARIVTRAIPWVEWMERLARPRYWMLPPKAADLTIGIAALVMSVFMFLPIPFGNTLPALSVILLALSLSERDGLWLLAGFATSLASFAVVAAVFAAGAFAMLSFF